MEQTITAKDLINYLMQFDVDTPVLMDGFIGIDGVKKAIWTDTNYPFDKPDKEVLLIY